MTRVITVLFLVLGFSANAFNEATSEQAELDGIALTSGLYHTCGIKVDGTLICFGGDGDDQRKDFPEGVRFKSVSSGYYHTCGIKEDGALLCFGEDKDDQRKDFPEGVRFKSVSVGGFHACGVREDGTLLCFGQDRNGQRRDFPHGVRFKSVSAGKNHTCGIKEDGELHCFGQDDHQQRKDFPTSVRFKSVSAGGYHTCGVKEDGELLCFGGNEYDQRKDFPQGMRFKSISTGCYHTCGVEEEEGTLLCFGQDRNGQRRDFPHGVQFKSLSAGRNHTCGIKEDGTLLCFGNERSDQRKGMPTEEFPGYAVLAFKSFEKGLLKLSRYVYPEKVEFVKTLSQVVETVPSPSQEGPFSALGYKQSSARLLAFNYLEPFLSAIETEAVESKVLPRYRSELTKWNGLAGVTQSSEIFFSDQSYSVSLDYLIAALRACEPLEWDEGKHFELTQLLTCLGEIKASGVVRVGDVLLELDSHDDLLNDLKRSSATKGFLGVTEQVCRYLSAHRRNEELP